MRFRRLPKEYRKILKHFKKRLWQKHTQYGLGYLTMSQRWLYNRLRGELEELRGELFSTRLSGGFVVTEAMDVAICAFLIASRHLEEVLS